MVFHRTIALHRMMFTEHEQGILLNFQQIMVIFTMCYHCKIIVLQIVTHTDERKQRFLGRCF